MKKISRYRENREMLKALSQQVKPLIKEGAFDYVNDALMELIYKQNGNDEFHTLPDWNKKGFNVKKGSQAFLIWGRPKNTANPKQEEPETQDDDNEEDNQFWPLCYLFSNLQVEPRDERRAA